MSSLLACAASRLVAPIVEIGAGVDHVLVEPQPVEGVGDVVVIGDVSLVLRLCCRRFRDPGQWLRAATVRRARREQERQRHPQRSGRDKRLAAIARLRAFGRRAARSNSVPLTTSSRRAAHRLASVVRRGARTSPATAPSSATAIASASAGQSAGTRAPFHSRNPNSRPSRRCAWASSAASPVSLFSALSILSPSRRRARIASCVDQQLGAEPVCASGKARRREGTQDEHACRRRHDDRPGFARRTRRDRGARSRGLHWRSPVSPLAARLHPRAVSAADRRALRRAGRRLCADVGARGRPHGAHLFACRRPRPRRASASAALGRRPASATRGRTAARRCGSRCATTTQRRSRSMRRRDSGRSVTNAGYYEDGAAALRFEKRLAPAADATAA